MKTSEDGIDFSKVAEALKEYDEAWALIMKDLGEASIPDLGPHLTEAVCAADAKEKLVKERFAEATSDRNDWSSALMIPVGSPVAKPSDATQLRRWLMEDGLYSGIGA